MASALRNIAVVSTATIGSRILGLLREILMFAMLGAGLWSSAFVLAFTLPNLFRRLLGEGALSSALLPLFSAELEANGRPGAFAFLNQALSRVLVLLVAVAVGGAALLMLLSSAGGLPEKWRLGAGLGAVLLPYMVLVCVAALVSAALNVLGRFFAAASGPVWLNLGMIAAIAAALMLDAGDSAAGVRWLCAGVFVGGLLQLAVPAGDLLRQGWRPAPRFERSDKIAELWRLFAPGVAGAAILQVNIMVSRFLAYSLNDHAASVLYLGSRLMELPLGVFTVAVATVYFPLLARSAREPGARFGEDFGRAVRMVLLISLPAGLGLLVLGEPIVSALFRWGAFDAADVARTVPVVAVYGVGLPFYSVATIATRGLHALKDMRTPVRIAGLCLAANVVLSLALMLPFGAAGLAAANVGAALLQSVLLLRALRRVRPETSLAGSGFEVAKMLGAALVMAALCLLALQLAGPEGAGSKTGSVLTTAALVPAGALVYGSALAFLRCRELGEAGRLVKGRFAARAMR